MPDRSDHDARAVAVLGMFPAGMPLLGAEIGVFCGDMSRELLSRRSHVRLLMVDTWSTFDQDSPYGQTGDPHAFATQAEQDENEAVAREQVEFAGDRSIIMKMSSAEASEEVDDASLDFVFLDADHSYEGVKEDIKRWARKVKPGGYLCGHDYSNKWHFDFEGRDRFGVKRAVDEFGGKAVVLGDDWTWFVRMGSNGQPVKPS